MHQVSYAVRSLCLFVGIMLAAQQSFSQTLSDNEVRKNIAPIPEPLKQITSLDPVIFEYNTGRFGHLKLPAGSQYGFMTEEFEDVFPALVYKKSHSYMAGKNLYRNAVLKGIDMEGLIPVLIASIKEQQLQIDQLRTEIEALKKR